MPPLRTTATTRGDLTVIRHHRQWRVHEFLTSHRGLIVLLAAVDAVVAAYLIATPDERFAVEDTWTAGIDTLDALQLPATVTTLGVGLAVVAAGTWCGVFGARWIARLSLLAALAPWGIIISSFAVAWTQTGIGFMTATLAAAVVVLHLASVGHFPPARRL